MDREVKAPLYAEHGVPEYWLVDIPAATIEVYREPSEEGYRSMARATRGETLHPVSLPGFAVRTDEILP